MIRIRVFCDRCRKEICNDGINDDGTIFYIDVSAGHVENLCGGERLSMKAAGENMATAFKKRRIYCEECVNNFRKEFEGAWTKK